MRRVKGIVLCAGALVASAQGLQAESAASSKPAVYEVVNRAITLDEAVRIALRESPLVKGSSAEVAAAQARVNSAMAETRPSASVNVFASGGSNSSITSTTPGVQPEMIMGLPEGRFSDGNLMVMYPLFTGGRLSATVAGAGALRDASSADLEAQRQDVALMTRNAANEALARKSLVEVAEARLNRDKERLRQDKERLQQEQIPAYYIQRDEAEVAASAQEVTNAKRDVELALIQLKAIMGIDPLSEIEVQGDLRFVPREEIVSGLLGAQPAPDGESAELLELARRQRPELSAAGQRLSAAHAAKRSARAAFSPQISLFGSGDVMDGRGMDRSGGVTFGVVASMGLYNGGQRRAAVAEAEAERTRKESERAGIDLRVAQEVQTAIANLKAAEQNVATAKAAVDAARAESDAAQKRYEVGRSTVVEVLDSTAARVRAETNVIQALYDYNVASDALRRAVGDPGLMGDSGKKGG